MRIKLIKKRTYNKLLSIYNKYPKLTLQNKGYETINRDNFNEKEREADKEINSILSDTITAFRGFQNFCLSKDGEIQIRLQYDYNYDGGIAFTGVGYILLDELMNGFKQQTNKN